MERSVVTLAVRHWQELFGLAEWEITVDFDTPCSEDADAEIVCVDKQQSATIYLASGWEKWDGAKMNRVTCHEVFHALVRDLMAAALSAEKLMSLDAKTLYSEQLLQAEELLINRASTALARRVGPSGSRNLIGEPS